MLEREILNAIFLECGALPGVVLHRNSVGQLTEYDDKGQPRHVRYGVGGKGAPDILAEVQTPHGWLAVWIECKRAAGQLSPDQQRWHDAAHAAGRHCFTVRSASEARAVIAGLQGAR